MGTCRFRRKLRRRFLFCPRKPARKSREKKGKELKPFLHRCEAAATVRLAAAKLAGVRVEAVRQEEEGAELTFAQVRSGNSGTRSGAKRRHLCDQRQRNLPGAAGFMPVQSAGRNACGRKTPHRTGDAGVKPCGRAIGWHRAARRRHVWRCGGGESLAAEPSAGIERHVGAMFGDAGGGKALQPSHRLASSGTSSPCSPVRRFEVSQPSRRPASSGTSAPCLAMRRFEALRTAYCPSEISGESASSRA